MNEIQKLIRMANIHINYTCTYSVLDTNNLLPILVMAYIYYSMSKNNALAVHSKDCKQFHRSVGSSFWSYIVQKGPK